MKPIVRAGRMKPVHSDIRGPLFVEAMKRQKQGINILKLNTGNPATFGFGLPDSIKNALMEHMQDGVGYCDFKGMPQARQAICDYETSKGIKERPDVKSVVHAHPMYATSFACCGMGLTEKIMPEAVLSLGEVPLAKYGTPSTDEIPDAVAEYLDYYDAVLLENHGALTYSDSLMNAYFKMESLEFYARLLYQAKMLGGPKELPEEQVLRLYSMRSQYGLTGRHPADKLKK